MAAKTDIEADLGVNVHLDHVIKSISCDCPGSLRRHLAVTYMISQATYYVGTTANRKWHYSYNYFHDGR